MGKDKEEEQLVSKYDLGGQNGFNCPVCHKFIPISAKDLFQKVAIKCPSCSLSLTVDKNADNTLDIKAYENTTIEEKAEIDKAFTEMMLK